MDVVDHNRQAWDKKVEREDRWTSPVSSDAIARARANEWQIVLTPAKPVPREWLGNLIGKDVLCLASGGGQQGPILAAAGANVCVFDNSPKQLAQDQSVARRESLTLHTVQGDMCDLSPFADACFDLIVHPIANCFVPEIRPVWTEAFRVLRAGGHLLAGFVNPIRYLFADERREDGDMTVTYGLPYSDLTSMAEQERTRLIERGEPLEFGHTLDDQIGGQIEAGFTITGFYEDRYDNATADPLSKYIASFIATRATKPS